MLSELGKLMFNALYWKDSKVAKGKSLPAFSTETQIFHILITGTRADNSLDNEFKVIILCLCWKIFL